MAEHCERDGLCVYCARRAVLGAGLVVGEVRRMSDKQGVLL